MGMGHSASTLENGIARDYAPFREARHGKGWVCAPKMGGWNPIRLGWMKGPYEFKPLQLCIVCRRSTAQCIASHSHSHFFDTKCDDGWREISVLEAK
jgi:hypothetical protein